MAELYLPNEGGLVPAPTSRRGFFKHFGAGAAALAVVASGCDSDDGENNGAATLDFSSDVGVLNYAYALEQLEAAFYARVIGDAGFSSTFSAAEQTVLRDIAAHEAVHAAFLRTALGSSAIGSLAVDFSSITFTNKTNVLAVARTFEDLGVSAYNGAGKYLTSAANLVVAGKIVSVEARHASAIRDLILANVRSGATVGEAGSGLPEVVIADALEDSNEPSTVLAAASAFITTEINLTNVPS